MIRLMTSELGDDEILAVAEVLRSGLLVQGDRVSAFERAVASYVGTRHAVAVSSGTAALHVSLLALDVLPGDRVIVPTYSWVATANVVEMCGATPVFVDIDPRTFNMAPNCLEKAMEQLFFEHGVEHRVKAIMPVHAFGLMADMTAINKVAMKYGISVVEDAACALGASLDGRSAGTWGIMGCFSFHPRKVITTGEGGVIVTDSDELGELCRQLRNHGQVRSEAGVRFVRAGLNYRMSEIHAAIGVVQMGKINRILSDRKSKASRYSELLAPANVTVPFCPDRYGHTYQSYVVKLPLNGDVTAAEFVLRAKTSNVEVSIGTCHIPMTDFYREKYNFSAGQFLFTDECLRRSVALPLHERLTLEEQERVLEIL